MARAVRRTVVTMINISGAGQSRRADDRAIAESSLFDEDWYLRNYPDVAEAGMDPLRHYMNSGWREGRDPGPEFATAAYLRANPDVARSGVNPLLHYVEFGHAEGRGTFGHRPPLQSREPTNFDFAAAAPCRSFALPQEVPSPWPRAYRFDRSRPDCIVVGDIAVGYSGEAVTCRDVEKASALLELLSGVAGWASKGTLAEFPCEGHQLVDSWYLNQAQLRTRWTGESWPFVVRALQHDPICDGAICLVGEGLVRSQLDIVDLQLRDAFYPLLFFFCGLDGTVHGCRLLAFPSLCRGGTHYPELIGAAKLGASEPIEPLGHSDALARRLLQLLNGDRAAAVERIVVDLHEADGATPLFQPSFRRWLQTIVRVGVEPARGSDETPAGHFLADAARLEPSDSPRNRGAKLFLSHDMVPTIAALTEPQSSDGEKRGESVVPLLLAGSQPATLVSLVEFPRDIMAQLGNIEASVRRAWPWLMDEQVQLSAEAFPPAAIRAERGLEVGDAELLVPVANDASIESRPRAQITWLIEAKGWHDGELLLAIHSLTLQGGGAGDCLAIVGPVDSATLSGAQQLFGGRAAAFPDIKAAALRLDTSLVAFVGPGVILHDSRAAGVMEGLLENEAVATASCVLVRAAKQGRGWHAATVDLGSFVAEMDGALDNRNLVQQLWRSNYPVAAPPSDLWMTRSASLRNWLEKGAIIDEVAGFHVCSFAVTASYVERDVPNVRKAFIPPAPVEHAIKLQACFG